MKNWIPCKRKSNWLKIKDKMCKFRNNKKLSLNKILKRSKKSNPNPNPNPNLPLKDSLRSSWEDRE